MAVPHVRKAIVVGLWRFCAPGVHALPELLAALPCLPCVERESEWDCNVTRFCLGLGAGVGVDVDVGACTVTANVNANASSSTVPASISISTTAGPLSFAEVGKVGATVAVAAAAAVAAVVVMMMVMNVRATVGVGVCVAAVLPTVTVAFQHRKNLLQNKEQKKKKNFFPSICGISFDFLIIPGICHTSRNFRLISFIYQQLFFFFLKS